MSPPLPPQVTPDFKEDPWVATSALLPVYEMVARVKAQDYWQTDLLAGA